MKAFSASIISSGYLSPELHLQTALRVKLHDRNVNHLITAVLSKKIMK